MPAIILFAGFMVIAMTVFVFVIIDIQENIAKFMILLQILLPILCKVYILHLEVITTGKLADQMVPTQ